MNYSIEKKTALFILILILSLFFTSCEKEITKIVYVDGDHSNCIRTNPASVFTFLDLTKKPTWRYHIETYNTLWRPSDDMYFLNFITEYDRDFPRLVYSYYAIDNNPIDYTVYYTDEYRW